MTVFVVLKQLNHDLSPAENYGTLDFLFPLGINVINPAVIIEAAKRWCQDFDFQDDYFLPVGNPIVVSIVSMCLVEEAIAMQVDTLNMLEWDNKSREYVAHEYTLSDWENVD